MKLRKIAILLALLMLVSSLPSCSGTETTETEAAADSENAVVETETEAETEDLAAIRAKTPDTLPADLDFDGRTFRIFTPEHLNSGRYYAGNEELSGEVVNDAVLARNLSVEERLNIDLIHEMSVDATTTNYKTMVSKLIMSGDSTYDIYQGYQHILVTMMTSSGFINHYDLDYIDFDQPWWWNNYMDALTMNKDVRIFSIGDYSIHALSFVRALYYNKDLYQKYYQNGDGLYEIVLSGDWTLDTMTEIAENAYVDTNGDGTVDPGDQLGFINYYISSSVDSFVYATDIEFSKTLDDGRIELNMIQEDAVTLLEKLNKLFWLPGSYHDFEGNDPLTGHFSEGNTMFLGSAFYLTAESLRDMTSSYGIIPNPKLDAEQENYRSLVHDAAMLTAISGSSLNLDMAGAVLEALCSETYRTVVPAYYETALKIKYSRDELSAQMIDLIHDSMYTSFIYTFNYSVGNIGIIYRELVAGQKQDYVSAVTSRINSSQKSLDKLYEEFTKNITD